MALSPVIIFEPGKHDYLIPAFAFIHEDCVETDYTLATFHPPFHHKDPCTPDERVLKYWQNNAAKAADEEKVIFMQMVGGELAKGYSCWFVMDRRDAARDGRDPSPRRQWTPPRAYACACAREITNAPAKRSAVDGFPLRTSDLGFNGGSARAG